MVNNLGNNDFESDYNKIPKEKNILSNSLDPQQSGNHPPSPSPSPSSQSMYTSNRYSTLFDVLKIPVTNIKREITTACKNWLSYVILTIEI